MSPFRTIDRLMSVLLNTSNNKEQFHHNEIMYSRTNLERLLIIIKISMTLKRFYSDFSRPEIHLLFSGFCLLKLHALNRQYYTFVLIFYFVLYIFFRFKSSVAQLLFSLKSSVTQLNGSISVCMEARMCVFNCQTTIRKKANLWLNTEHSLESYTTHSSSWLFSTFYSNIHQNSKLIAKANFKIVVLLIISMQTLSLLKHLS